MTKAIDTVEMTRRIRDAHAEAMKGATHEVRIRFYREKAHKMHESRRQSSAKKSRSLRLS